MRSLRIWTLTLCALGIVLAQAAQADDILDQINQAVEMYKNGDYAGAASGLEFAATQIRQLRAGEISKALPDALPGWTAEEAKTAAAGAAMFGGGTTASREYTKGDANIDIQIVTDSPLLQSVAMMLNNPMLMSGSGQKLVRVKGNKASLEWSDDSGKLSVVVQNVVLITVDGSNCTQDDVMKYGEAINYDLIKQSINQ